MQRPFYNPCWPTTSMRNSGCSSSTGTCPVRTICPQ
jgi:hypothetical protein